jgi:hypothetical protein
LESRWATTGPRNKNLIIQCFKGPYRGSLRDLMYLQDQLWYLNTPNFRKITNFLRKLDNFGARLVELPSFPAQSTLGWVGKREGKDFRNFLHPCFDEALTLYMEGQRVLTLVSDEALKVDIPKHQKRLSGKLPLQARLFRAWSRLSHKVIKQWRKETNDSKGALS